MAENSTVKYWAIVPAAGRGLRMNSKKPKQYLTIAGKTILEHSLAPLLANEKIHKVVVALAKDDKYWRTLAIAKHSKIITTTGGDERCHSVFNAMETLQSYAYDDDWVLVHDAARPLLNQIDLNNLMSEVAADDVGGLLGAPIHATIKRVNDNSQVEESVPRRSLWRAFTPQMFRYGLLYKALCATLPDNPTSDSAKAIEQLGYKPKMVEGRSDNIKVTRPADMVWAEKLLQSQGEY
jgi:2-C-methyl-D-erythritol 4-phosphate cytidylyltransferase